MIRHDAGICARMMEKDGLLPVPIFINGVEGHTVVRDLLTSSFEQRRRAEGIFDVDTLSPDCAEVRVVLTSPRFWAGREISRVGKKKAFETSAQE